MKAVIKLFIIALFLLRCSSSNKKQPETPLEGNEGAESKEKVDSWRKSETIKCGPYCEAHCDYFTDVLDSTKIQLNASVYFKRYQGKSVKVYGQYDKKTGKASGTWKYEDWLISIEFTVENGVAQGNYSGILDVYGKSHYFTGFYKNGWCDSVWTEKIYDGTNVVYSAEWKFKDGDYCDLGGTELRGAYYRDFKPHDEIDINSFGLEYHKIGELRKIFKPLPDRLTGVYRYGSSGELQSWKFSNVEGKLVGTYSYDYTMSNVHTSNEMKDLYFNGCDWLNIEGYGFTKFETDESGRIYFYLQGGGSYGAKVYKAD